MATATKVVPEGGSVQLLAADGREFRSRIGSISRQSAVFFAGTIVTSAAGYFFKVYLSRKLGAEALGLYTLGMTLVGFLGLFNALGMPAAAARFVSAYSARREYGRLGDFLRGSVFLLLTCNLLLGAAVVLLGPWLITRFYHTTALNPYLWIFASIMLFGVLNGFLGQAMAGYRDVSRRTLITHFTGTPANILFAVVLISMGFGLGGYLVAQVASAFLVLALLVLSIWKMTPAAARVGGPVTKVESEVITFSAAAFGISAVDFALSQSDKIVLGFYLNATQVGIYAVAMAVVGFVPIALQSVNQIFSPTISELHATGNRLLLQQLYSTLTKWILLLTLPLALTVIFFSRSLMEVFGKGFAPGSAVLMIGAAGQLFNCAVGSVGYLLMMSGNQLQLAKIQAVNAGLMIALSFMLVPRMGVKGAALASAVSVLTANLWMLGVVRRILKLFPYHRGYLKLVVPAMISAGVIWVMERISSGTHAQWRVAIPALLCSYAALLGLVFFSGLDEHDRMITRVMGAKIGENLRKYGVVV
jgi:O-antigen/teichoic acid export membrane protein